MADGGEGTMDVLVAALGGEVRTPDRVGPARPPASRPASRCFPTARAVVEMAQASGLSLVAEPDRDAWAASTRGTAS